MAKIDISSIQGYESMTPEEKIQALEGFEFDSPEAAEIVKLKEAVSKANSEAADYKRKLRARLSEEEANAAQEAEAKEQMQRELEQLREEKAISGYTASFLALGYDEDVAKESAAALYRQDYATVFEHQKIFAENIKKRAATELLKSQPELTHGAAVTAATAEEQIDARLRRSMGLPPTKKG